MQRVSCECAKDYGEGDDGKREAPNFVIDLIGRTKRHFRDLADDEFIALIYRFNNVGAFDFMADVFNPLVERDGEEQKKDKVRHAAHDRGIAKAKPADRGNFERRANAPAKPSNKIGGSTARSRAKTVRML